MTTVLQLESERPCQHVLEGLLLQKGFPEQLHGAVVSSPARKIFLEIFSWEDAEIRENDMIALERAAFYQLVWSLIGNFTHKLEVK